MRFLADENFSGLAVAALREAGHDVAWVRDTKPGASDSEVLAWATRELRILLTFDKEFGELASRSIIPDECGIVLIRLPMPRPGDPGKELARLLSGRTDWPAPSQLSNLDAFGCAGFDENGTWPIVVARAVCG